MPEVTKPVEEIKNTAQVHKTTKKKSVKAAEGKKVATPEKAVTAQKPKEPVAETSATPALDGAKISYASMVSFLLADLTFYLLPYMQHLFINQYFFIGLIIYLLLINVENAGSIHVEKRCSCPS